MNRGHLNATASSLSNPHAINMTATDDKDQNVVKVSNCLSWNFFFSEKASLPFFLILLLGLVLLSCATNGSLFFLIVKYKQLLWQPQYIMLKHISACGVGLSFLTALVVLSSVVREQTQVYGYWCIAQFSMLRCSFLVSQMTLALMTVERYIFICHGIHYLRMIKTGNVHLGMGLVWLVSVTLSFHTAFLLIRGQRGFNRQTTGLMCDAVAIEEHIGFSLEEDLLVFGPPAIIMTLCLLVICYCYACMYSAALRVTMALKCSNHRANRTVSFYLFIYLLQLGPSLLVILLTIMGKRNASIALCKRFSSIVTPLLIIAPTCVNAAVPLIRNPQIKRALVSVYRQRCQSRVQSEMEFRQSRRVDGMGRVWQVEGERQVEPERTSAPPPPLPGHAVPSVPEDCQ